MNIYESYGKLLERPIDVSKPKKLNKIFGFNKTLNLIRGLSPTDLGHFRFGALGLGFTFAVFGYYCYRKEYEQKYVSSESLYKLIRANTINAGNQFYGTRNVTKNTMAPYSYYYRMPAREFDVLYRMRSAFISGAFDHNMEILFPEVKDGKDGYRVITPFYYYITPNLDIEKTDFEAERHKFKDSGLRAGMAVDRGWIPIELKDRRTRPHDINTTSEETIYGTLKYRTHLPHEFKTPNDPTLGVWNNFSLEDFAWYWDLPNLNSAKYVYFQQLDLENLDPTPQKDLFPIRTNIAEAIAIDAKEQGVNLKRSYSGLKKIYSSVSALCLYLYYLAL